MPTSPDCFTGAQIEALKKVYDGVREFRRQAALPGMSSGRRSVARQAAKGSAERLGRDRSTAASTSATRS